MCEDRRKAEGVGANEERTDGSSRESAGAAVGSSEVFDRHRPPLFSIDYRMLGSVMDAEDVVQEAYLRWQWASATEVRSPKAYLSSVVTRLCIDQLRSARTQREKYVGPWLPEPLPTGPAPDAVVIDETLSMAFLVLLESLNPTERAVFLLREVFDYDYHEISHLVGRSEAECRQIARRARQSVAARRPRFERSPEQEELRETSGQSAS
jgi:RNA polymerase sigma-70 factor, ECF subfamily